MEKLPSQPSRWWDWPTIGLHIALLETVAARLLATTWTPHLNLVEGFTAIGFVIGTSLGYSRFHRRLASWLTFFYMLVMLPLQWTLVIAKEVSLEEKLTSVYGRLYYAIAAFVERRPVDDTLFFVAIMSIAFWIISSWAGFTLVRNQNYLGAVLPSAIGLLIIQGYDNVRPGRMWFLAMFTFLALLLLGRLQFLKNRASWRARHIFLSPDNSFDLTSSMTVMAGLLIIAAWMAPASASGWDSAVKAWNEATRPWHDFTQRMENAVSALQSPNRGRPTEFYGTELRLGLGFPNSPTVMFTARTPNLPPGEEPPRYYWRGRVYDQFVDGEWQTTGTSKEDFLPTAKQPPSSAEETPARFSFQIGEGRMSLLYGPSEPIWMSRSGTRAVSSAIEGQEKEVFSWAASPVLMPGEMYQVDALIKNPTTVQLRGAGTEYPEWVTDKYLQLPEGFSPRIAALAQNITANANTPYDKATAVTNYLRKNLKYIQKIQSPPRDKDPLEWVLFEYKQAYCVYYATSEILMLRSVGIPARMAVGFTQGNAMTVDIGPGQQPRVIDGAYVVMRNNAHAWPEVYFPGIGWVEFEPTAGEAPLDRPQPILASENEGGLATDLRAEENQDPALDEPDAGVMDTPVPETAPSLTILYLLPLVIAGAALTIFLNRRYSLQARVPVFLRATLERSGVDVPVWVVHWEKWVKLSLIEKSFESINFALRWLDKPVPVHATPIERAAKLTSILPEQADQIKVLLDEHQTSLYTSRIGNATQARRAAFDIRKQAIIQRIRRFFFGKPLS